MRSHTTRTSPVNARLTRLVKPMLAAALVAALPACRDCETTASVPAGAIQPAVFEFGPLTLGSECQANLLVTNRGNVDLAVSSSALEDVNGDWTITKVPSLVRLGADEDLLVDYVADGAVGELQSATVQLVTDDPDNEGVLTAIVTAIVTDAPAPSVKSTCGPDGATTTPCASISYGAVQLNGAGLVLPVTIQNDGTADMNVTAALINDGNADFTVESVTRGNTIIELPTVVLPGRSADCGAPSGADNSITVNVRYTPSALGADVDTLLIVTDAVNVEGGTIEIALDGEGADVGILMNPDFLNFGALGEGDADTIDVTVKNVGTNAASVNESCVDLEDDGVCDAPCTGDPADSALNGTITCVVTTVDGGASGKGFVLDPTDGQAGGTDERIVSVTWEPVAGATSIPASAVLALHSNILGDRVFTAPIQGGSVGIITPSAGPGSACPAGEANVCVLATGTPGDENFGTWAGEATIVLENTGEASVEITDVEVNGGAATIDDDYTIVDDLVGTSIAPGASVTLTVAYDEVAPGNDAARSAQLTNVLVHHTGAGLVTTVTLDVVPPQ